MFPLVFALSTVCVPPVICASGITSIPSLMMYGLNKHACNKPLATNYRLGWRCPLLIQLCTELISNNAAAALNIPVALSMARELKVKVKVKKESYLHSTKAKLVLARTTVCLVRERVK